ncbi:hypothetical protein D3C81_2064390 [compost metagenome]
MPRAVWMSLGAKSSSILARSLRMATSITLVSLSKFISHTCDAISDFGSTSPRRRMSSSRSENSLAVRSIRLPFLVARRFSRSTSRLAIFMVV